LYAADSGIAVSTAFAMQNDHQARRLQLNRTTVGSLVIADRVQMSPFAQISAGPCNLCQINEGKIVYRVNNALTAWESRQTRPNGAADSQPWSNELSTSVLGVLIAIEPTDLPIDGAAACQQPDLNKLIRY
jgi:hypothetical protein